MEITLLIKIQNERVCFSDEANFEQRSTFFKEGFPAQNSIFFQKKKTIGSAQVIPKKLPKFPKWRIFSR
jgi:hypothetical protein